MNPDLSSLETAFEGLLAAVVSSGSETPAGPEGGGPSCPPSGRCAPRVRRAEFGREGYHLEVQVRPEQVMEAARIADRFGFSIDAVTGVDWIKEGEMEVVYDFHQRLHGWRLVIRTRVPRQQPELPSIHEVFPGANWHERETHEFFGIRFLGHPNLTPLLLPEDATYHPLRKDFQGAA